VRNKYQRKDRKSNHKFEVVRGQELLVQVPLPMAEVWAELQAQVEELTGEHLLNGAGGTAVSDEIGSKLSGPGPAEGHVVTQDLDLFSVLDDSW
jgi:hypothetical protein